jgi:peptidoglycan/LPS O-acetylase OafA/YrhL
MTVGIIFISFLLLIIFISLLHFKSMDPDVDKITHVGCGFALWAGYALEIFSAHKKERGDVLVATLLFLCIVFFSVILSPPSYHFESFLFWIAVVVIVFWFFCSVVFSLLPFEVSKRNMMTLW